MGERYSAVQAARRLVVERERQPLFGDRKVASLAQTRLILRCWTDGTQPPVLPGDPNKTLTACVNRGWFVATGEAYSFPNGQIGIRHCVTKDGLAAAVARLQMIAGR